jgi:tetratricopeptide (TPR) repeat protein
VDAGVIDTAAELFAARHYPGVVAVCDEALAEEPECTPILLWRARAHLALRRDLDAQADLRDLIRLDPGCATAFRLLGELAARRDEHASAAIFLREALRLAPDDLEAAEWLAIVGESAPVPPPVAAPARAPVPRSARSRQTGPPPPTVPELPGFGEYLVAVGILTRDRLRAAQVYQRSMGVPLSIAAVTLGLASPQRIEWARVAHHEAATRGAG